MAVMMPGLMPPKMGFPPPRVGAPPSTPQPQVQPPLSPSANQTAPSASPKPDDKVLATILLIVQLTEVIFLLKFHETNVARQYHLLKIVCFKKT